MIRNKNISMKSLGKATNIGVVANSRQINLKVRDSLSQNRSRLLNRDIGDLKVVYEIRQNRMRSASSLALGKKRSRSAISIFNSKMNPKEDNSFNQRGQQRLNVS